MTIAGIITLTAGFGYLLQYSFNHYFSDELKAISGFVLGFIVIAIGALIARKKPEFDEYAASVIALGVIFNFLTAYFIGPYYGMVNQITSLLLLFAVVAVSFYLSIAYQTKIVAVITVIGGMLMPFIMGDLSPFKGEFLSYILVLSAGNLYLSKKINWPTLLLTTPKVINIVKPTINIMFITAIILLSISPVTLFIKMSPTSNILVDLVSVLASLTFLYLITHRMIGDFCLLRRKIITPDVYLWGFHIIALMAYISVINMLVSGGVSVTIAILIHAVLVLFLTLNEKYKSLLKLSIGLYALTAGKMLFNDMSDYETMHKIIALMCIGSILMGSAYLFQHMKSKKIEVNI